MRFWGEKGKIFTVTIECTVCGSCAHRTIVVESGSRRKKEYRALNSEFSALQKQPYTIPTHLAQTQDPWYRLSAKHTLSSGRHEHASFDPLVPSDDLDFVLKSLYNKQGLFQGKSEVVKQPETFTDTHGRVLKNRIKVIKPAPPPLNHPLRSAEAREKRSIHCISNSIGKFLSFHFSSVTLSHSSVVSRHLKLLWCYFTFRGQSHSVDQQGIFTQAGRWFFHIVIATAALAMVAIQEVALRTFTTLVLVPMTSSFILHCPLLFGMHHCDSRAITT